MNKDKGLRRIFLAHRLIGPVPEVRTFVHKWRTRQDETANTYVVEAEK